MTFEISVEVAEQIGMFALYADMSTNLDLKRRVIETKKEYIANFTKRFAGFIEGPLSSGLSAETMIVPHKKKNQSGCDTTIIISSKGISKVAISKYKFPRVETSHSRWDKNQKQSNKSLFSVQLEKQQKYKDEYAIFQKFINNKINENPESIAKDTASCIWHSDAIAYDQNHRKSTKALWNHQQLLELFNQKQTADIGSILKTVCLDSIAKPVEIKQGIDNYVRDNQLPSRVLAINVLD